MIPYSPALAENRGFTLMELLIAMVLVSVVMVIAFTAFRLTISAWERGKKEGETPRVRVVVPAELRRQLADAVLKDPFSTNKDAASEQSAISEESATSEKSAGSDLFCGQTDRLVFFTTHAPQGSPYQGLLQVVYRFNAETGVLAVYQKAFTRPPEASESSPDPYSGLEEKGFARVAQVGGIQTFELAFSDKSMNSKMSEASLYDDGFWQASRDCDASNPPRWVRLKLGFDPEREKSGDLYFMPVAGG